MFYIHFACVYVHTTIKNPIVRGYTLLYLYKHTQQHKEWLFKQGAPYGAPESNFDS